MADTESRNRRRGLDSRILAAVRFPAAGKFACSPPAATPTPEPADIPVTAPPASVPSPTKLSIEDYPSVYQTFAGGFLVGAAVKGSASAERR